MISLFLCINNLGNLQNEFAGELIFYELFFVIFEWLDNYTFLYSFFDRVIKVFLTSLKITTILLTFCKNQ